MTFNSNLNTQFLRDQEWEQVLRASQFMEGQCRYREGTSPVGQNEIWGCRKKIVQFFSFSFKRKIKFS